MIDTVTRLFTDMRKQTICDACNDQAIYEIRLKDSTKVLWLCSKHQRHLWSLAEAQFAQEQSR